MIYNGYFRDRNNSIYTVKITTVNGDTTKEITLSGTPFTTEMEKSEDTIYKPAKYQTATVQAISEDYMFDIYTGKAQDTKVELYRGNDIMWTGYARPNVYDVGFEKRRELIEIECQDALSTLQYFPYRQADKKVRSFLYIVDRILAVCKSYKAFYVSDNTQLTSTSDSCIMNDIYISEKNFFGDKDDKKQTDDDVAWKCNEILEEICKYLGLTVIADKDKVYFLDYDAIKSGNNTYWKYSVGSDSGTKVNIPFNKKIVADDYSANGATLSIGDIYNKVTIKADLNDYDSIFPDFFDTATNITSDKTTSTDSRVQKMVVVKSKLGDKDDENMIVFLHNLQGQVCNFVCLKYFSNPNFKCYKYDGTKDISDSITTLSYDDTMTMHGATLAKVYVKRLELDVWRVVLDKFLKGEFSFDDWLIANDVSTIDLSDCIILTNPETNHIANEDIENYPYFQTSVSDATSLFGGENSYLVINGSYYYHSYPDTPYPIPDQEKDLDEGRYAMYLDQTYMICKLQWGDLFWDGKKWTNTNTTFQLPYLKEYSDIKDRRADGSMFKDMNIRNTVHWRVGVDKTGYLIKTPSDNLVSGLPILTVYKPYDPQYYSSKSGNDKGRWYHHNVVFLKNFSMECIVGDPTYSDSLETDTEYSLDIDTDYVNELDEIEFRINTWDNKKPNYSCVAYKTNDGNLHYLDRTYNKALASEVNGITFTDADNVETVSDGTLRQEWWLAYRIYKQYKSYSPTLEMNLRNNNEIYGLYTVHNLDGRQFIIDHINKDYANCSSEITLIEKK